MNTPIPSRLFDRNSANFAAQLPPKSVAVFTEGEPINLFEGLPTEIEEIENTMKK